VLLYGVGDGPAEEREELADVADGCLAAALDLHHLADDLAVGEGVGDEAQDERRQHEAVVRNRRLTAVPSAYRRRTAAGGSVLARSDYSHSIVPGGFDVMSYATRLMPFTSLMIREEIFASSS